METIADIKACLLRETGGGAHFTLAIDTLLRYGTNMVNNPEDEKFRKVNAKNPKYLERIGKYPAGVRLMEKLGFVSGVEEGKLIASGAPTSRVMSEIKGKSELDCDTPAVVAAEAAAPSEDVQVAPPALKINTEGPPPSTELKETPRNADEAAPAPEPEPTEQVAPPKEDIPKPILKLRVTPGCVLKKTGDGDKTNTKPKTEDVSKDEVNEAKKETLPSPKEEKAPKKVKSKPRKSPVPPTVASEGVKRVELSASTSTTTIQKKRCVLVETTSVVTRVEPPKERAPLVESVSTSATAAPAPTPKPIMKNQSTMKTPPPPSPPSEPTEPDYWACDRCTFHNALTITACDMCGTQKTETPQHADAQCSPLIPVPEELSRITVTSNVDVAVGQTPTQMVDSGCSPIPMQQTDAACTANLRNVKTPVDNEACLEEGLTRVRKRLAELCRTQNGGQQQPALSDLTNSAMNRNKNNGNNNNNNTNANGSRCPSQPTSRAGSTGVLRRELTGTLECGVCLCLMVYPVSTPCGHSFCRHCLTEAMSKTGKKCPTCRGACDFDAMKYPENKILADAAKLANPSEYSNRKKEADEIIMKLRRDACETTTLPVLIGDDCPCPGSTCKLQLAERRDVDLLRYISRNGGKFILLPSSEGSRVRKGAVGLSCSIRRAEDLPNGHAAASVNVGHRILVVKHSTAPEGHTNADVLKHEDANESSYEALAAVHHLKKILKEFFHSQGHGIQRQVERFAGPEPILPALPPTRTEGISLGATRYSFWAAAVMSHLRVLSKRLKPNIVTQKDCVSRATSLCHIIGATMRSGLVSRQPSGLHRYEAGGRREVRAA